MDSKMRERERERVRARERERGNQVEIVSPYLIQFRNLKQYHFLCILFVEAVTKFYPASRRNTDSTF